MTRALLVLALCSIPSVARADDGGRTGIAYGIASAELATVGAIAIHAFTPSTPGRGIGLAVNFLPMVVGIGMGFVAESQDLDARPALGFHGGVVGGLSLTMIGASIDGRRTKTGSKLGLASLALGAIGLAGGAYYSAARVDSAGEAGAVAFAPYAGAFAGSLVFAIAHFIDDRGPSSTGRLLRFTGAGMLVGVLGSFVYAFPDRSDDPTSVPRDRPRLFSVGGAF